MHFIEKLFSRPAYSLCAPMAGRAVPVTEVSDPAFSGALLGKGIAVIPTDGRVCAPCDATVDVVFTNGHAVSLIADFGAEILIHVGLGTAAQETRFFTTHIRSGQRVKQGDLLIEADLAAAAAAGLDLTTPMLVSNASEFAEIQIHTGTDVTNSDVVIQLTK